MSQPVLAWARVAWRDAVDRLMSFDPGLVRLRTAGAAAVAMATTLGVEWLLCHLTGADAKQQVVAMLLGSIVALLGGMGLANTPTRREQLVAAVYLPMAIGLGMLLGAAVSGHRDVLLAGFVAVMFVAVLVRRFGPLFFYYGFLAWMGYFFASFLGAGFGVLPRLVVATSVASFWVLLLVLTVLRRRPDKAVARGLAAFHARARAVADAAYDVLLAPGNDRRRRRLRSRVVRLTEAALMVDGQLGEPNAASAGRAAALRRWLVDCELAVDEVARSVQRLVSGDHDQTSALARQVTYRLSKSDNGGARHAAHVLRDAAGDGPQAPELRHLAGAALDYLDALAGEPDTALDVDEFEPALSLRLGNLPTSAAVATDVAPHSRDWNPLAGLSMTTRQAIQVALAGSLAIVAGRELSDRRYYWAILASFVVFSGTATRSETVVKGASRVAGTVVGLGAAIVLANVTAHDTDAVLATILISLFLGYYMLRVSYGVMIFFITIVVAQLYSVLHEFSDHLLFLRLEETAIGAGIGMLVGAFFLPVSTRDTARAARSSFYAALRDLLDAVAERLAGQVPTSDLEAAARAVDAQQYQLGQVLKPLTRRYHPGDSAVVSHRITLYGTAAADARAVVASLRHGPGVAEPGPVADAVRRISAACAVLTENDPNVDTVVRALSAAGKALSTHAGPGDPLTQALTRLVRALRRLNDLPADVAAPEPALLARSRSDAMPAS